MFLALGVFLVATAWLSAQPDPRDSVIIESKTVAPNLNGTPAFTVKVYLTNKDSLTFLTLVLGERTIAGTGYATLATPRSFFGVVTPLTNTLRYFSADGFSPYNNSSPDSFLVAAGFDPSDRDGTIEPPNAARKPVWELKFNHTSDSAGQILLYNSRVAGLSTTFTDSEPKDMPVNFLPGVLTLEYLKGDLNGDAGLSPADVALILNCIFCSSCPPPPRGFEACDLNCDGQRSPADVVLELNAVFMGQPFPC